jgi:hypothetical protein
MVRKIHISLSVPAFEQLEKLSVAEEPLKSEIEENRLAFKKNVIPMRARGMSSVLIKDDLLTAAVEGLHRFYQSEMNYIEEARSCNVEPDESKVRFLRLVEKSIKVLDDFLEEE